MGEAGENMSARDTLRQSPSGITGFQDIDTDSESDDDDNEEEDEDFDSDESEKIVILKSLHHVNFNKLIYFLDCNKNV